MAAAAAAAAGGSGSGGGGGGAAGGAGKEELEAMPAAERPEWHAAFEELVRKSWDITAWRVAQRSGVAFFRKTAIAETVIGGDPEEPFFKAYNVVLAATNSWHAATMFAPLQAADGTGADADYHLVGQMCTLPEAVANAILAAFGLKTIDTRVPGSRVAEDAARVADGAVSGLAHPGSLVLPPTPLPPKPA